jgi:hypothetical protein
MSETPLLGITELEAAQSQPEVPVNEAVRVLESGVAQLIVLDKDLNVPPVSPAEGDIYIVPSGSTGEWGSFPFHVALCRGGGWVYFAPRVGMLAYLTDEDAYYQFSSGSPSGWNEITLGGTSGGGGGIDGVTVQDVGSPTTTYNLITNIQFVGNVSVTQSLAGTVLVNVGGGSVGGGDSGIAGISVAGTGSPGATIPVCTSIQFAGLCEVSDSGSGVAVVTVFGDGGGGSSGVTSYATTLTDATTARVLSLTDAGTYIRMTSGSANTVTVPPEASVPWANDTEISIRQAGAGSTSVVAGAGVTINASSLTALGQHATMTLKKVGADTWDLMGATA